MQTLVPEYSARRLLKPWGQVAHKKNWICEYSTPGHCHFDWVDKVTFLSSMVSKKCPNLLTEALEVFL